MTALVAPLRGRRIAASAFPTPLEGLTVLAAASLGFRSERYPSIEFGSLDVTLQDLLFLALVAVAAPELARWMRRRPVVAVTVVLLVTALALSALDSPLRDDALVAVAKYAEFVLAGAALACGLGVARRPEWATAALVAAVGVNDLAALADVRTEGIRALFTGRLGGLLGTEDHAALAGAAAIWCSVRLTRLRTPFEDLACRVGLAAAGLGLILTKSALAAGVALGLLVLTPIFHARVARVIVVGVVALAVVIAAGRATDVAGLLTGVNDAADARDQVSPPTTGKLRSFYLPYAPRAPERLAAGSFTHRVALGHLGLRLATDAPLRGRGWLTTSDPQFLRSEPFDLYMLDRFPRLDPSLFISTNPTALHNGYLQVAAEAGLPALGLLLGLLVSAVAVATTALRALRRATNWLIACGAGWVILIAVFLFSSTLYGGQVETVMLGAATVMATWRARPNPSARGAALTVLAALALVGTWLLVLTAPGSRGDSPDGLRVRLSYAAGEIWAPGTRVSAGTTIDNDITSVRFGRAPFLTVRSGGARARLLVPGLLSAVPRVEERTAGQITARGVRVERGVPGVVLVGRSPAVGAYIEVPGYAPLLAGGRRIRARASVTGWSPIVLSDRHGKDVVVVMVREGSVTRVDAGTLIRTKPLGGIRPAIYAATYRIAGRGRGSYLYLPPGARRARIQVRYGSSVSRHVVALPWVLHDRSREGLAELASLGRQAAERAGVEAPGRVADGR